MYVYGFDLKGIFSIFYFLLESNYFLSRRGRGAYPISAKKKITPSR